MADSEMIALNKRVRSRGEWRRIFMDEIASAADLLERDAAGGDDIRQLPQETVAFLRGSQLRWLKYPAVLGGAEADNALQFEIFEQLAYHNAAASWCMFIYTDLIGRMAAFLPQAGVDRVFGAGTDLPLICGGGGMLLGDLTPADGGYRVSGRWIYGSGIDGAEWVVLTAADKNREGPPEILTLLVPRTELRIDDNWNVLGMRASGSSDFHADDVFVPAELTFRFGDPPVRGGGIFYLGMAGYVAHTVPAAAVGLARRAKDDAIATARSKIRGYTKRVQLAERGVFQNFLGLADLKLKSARLLMLENGERLVADAERTGAMNPANEAEVRAAGYYVTRLASEVVNETVRYIGGDAIRIGSVFERALRDVHTAATHFCVSDTSVEAHAQFLLGLEGADPFA